MNNPVSSTFPRQNNDEHKTNREINNNNIIIIRDTAPGVSEREEAHRAAVKLLSDARDVILPAYEDNVGTHMTGAVADMLVHFIMDGHSIDNVLDAIERTGFAPRPTPAYLRAVLRNYDSQIIKKPRKKSWYTSPYGEFRSENNLPF